MSFPGERTTEMSETSPEADPHHDVTALKERTIREVDVENRASQNIHHESADSAEPSLSVVESGQSKTQPSTTTGGFTKSTRSIDGKRPNLPVPSVNSMKSDWSMLEPPNMTEEFAQSTEVQLEGSDSISSIFSSHQSDARHIPSDLDSHCTAGPGNVLCSVCPKRAFKSCLTCIASFCETHVRHHYTTPALQRHKLEEATGDLEQRLCQQHYRVLELFCKTDQTPVCVLCVAKQHGGHEITELEKQSLQMKESEMAPNKNLPAPGPIEFLLVKTDSVSLRWGHPAGLSTPHKFRVTWRSKGDCGRSLIVTGEKVDIFELISGEKYEFTVATIMDDGSQSPCVSATQCTDIPVPENLTVITDLPSVSVTWSKPAGVDNVSYLLTLSSEGECLHSISTNSLHYSFNEIPMYREYSISVSTVLEKGSQSKPISRNITSVPAPENLTVDSVTATSANLSWSLSCGTYHTPHSFLISYHSEGTESQTISTDSCSAVITGLKPETEYTVNVLTVLKQGKKSRPCSTTIRTGEDERLNKLIQNSKVIELGRKGRRKVYQLKTEETTLYSNVRRWTFGKRNDSKKNRIILLVGETGTGKTTLINTLVNHALGVEFDDGVWFEISECTEEFQIHTQTTAITVYEVFVEEISFSLTIIDTPGYGDTRGPLHDTLIAESLLGLFKSESGVHEVDIVGLVLNAATNRLTPTQLYIFDAVLSLFGKDIEGNIVLLITHSYGLHPTNALTAVKEAKIPCAKKDLHDPIFFLFNNCQCHFQEEDKSTVKSSWDRGVENIERLYQFLDGKKRKSMELTKGVLRERVQLEACVNNLAERIKWIELIQKKLKQTQDAIEKNEENLKHCEKFNFVVDEPKKVLSPIDRSGTMSFTGHENVQALIWNYFKGATYCTTCEENCHCPGCWVALNPSKCEVMKEDHCTVCTKKCPSSHHRKDGKMYKTITNRVIRTDEDLKKGFKDASDKSRIFEEVKKRVEADLEKATVEKCQLVQEAYQSIMTLREIALEKDSVFTLVHLEFLTEKMEEIGETEKMKKLQEMQKTNKAKQGAVHLIQVLYHYILKKHRKSK